MDNTDPTERPDDPVIEEIRAIREENARRTEGLTDEERLNWYKAQAQKALNRVNPAKAALLSSGA